jgi:RHS repeat-associated protein
MLWSGAGVTGTEFGNWTMSYDDESRLTSVTSPAGSESFVYNALGQRMQLTVGGVITKYVYDGDRVLEERDSSGNNVLARYTTTNSSYYGALLHLKRATGESRFPMYDLTGSVRGLLDASGAVTDTYTLEAFGKQRSSTGTTPNPYRFGGAWGYINGVSGLQQLGARFYWPEIGRFVQQDPVGEGMNWYAYARNNPVVGVDPGGLWRDDGQPWRATDVQAFGQHARGILDSIARNPGNWKLSTDCADLAMAVLTTAAVGLGKRVSLYQADQEQTYCSTEEGGTGYLDQIQPNFAAANLMDNTHAIPWELAQPGDLLLRVGVKDLPNHTRLLSKIDGDKLTYMAQNPPDRETGVQPAPVVVNSTRQSEETQGFQLRRWNFSAFLAP